MSTTRVCAGVVFASLLFLAADGATVNAARAIDTISVTGEAEVRVVPDEVILTLGVETFDRVLGTAKTGNDERVKRTIAAARARGVAAEHIQTDFLSIEPRHRDSNIVLELLGFVVRKTVVIRLGNVARFEDLLTAVLDAGATHVHDIEFRTTSLRAHRDRARTLAMQAAREKAGLLAKESGRTLGVVQTIGEASYGYWSSYGAWWGSRRGMAMQNVVQNLGGAPLANDTTLAPGQISIRASVHTVFGLN